MSILERAREQARAAAEQARAAAEEARAAAEARAMPARSASSDLSDESAGDIPDTADGATRGLLEEQVDPRPMAVGSGPETGVASADASRESLPDPLGLAHLGLNRAKAGLASVVDRIDPALLADVVIKATSLQESANVALDAKGSPYRISDILITATIPPQLTFSISRRGDGG